jgi:uncharacterized membrane protein
LTGFVKWYILNVIIIQEAVFMTETSSGLKQNVAGVICYIWWVGAIVMLIAEPKNKFVRFHAFQSIVVFGFFTILFLIFGFIANARDIMLPLLGAFSFIIIIAMMLVAAQDKIYKIPWAGTLAEKWANQSAE